MLTKTTEAKLELLILILGQNLIFLKIKINSGQIPVVQELGKNSLLIPVFFAFLLPLPLLINQSLIKLFQPRPITSLKTWDITEQICTRVLDVEHSVLKAQHTASGASRREEGELSRRKLGHWTCSLEGDTRTLALLFLFASWTSWVKETLTPQAQSNGAVVVWNF